MNSINVVATIGPSSSTKEILIGMIQSGMTHARLNFSWGTHQEHKLLIETIREAAVECGVTIPIIQDLSGPRVQYTEGHSFDTTIQVFTNKDLDDVRAMLAERVEYVALSFVSSPADIHALATVLRAEGSTAKIIAKIERVEALQNLSGIVEVADAIMIARGDLREAVPFETLPFVQKEILTECVRQGIASIVATEMLSSMINADRPSCADVSDIATAVLDGALGTMLSNETAAGKYPVAAVAVMRKVVDEASHRLVK